MNFLVWPNHFRWMKTPSEMIALNALKANTRTNADRFVNLLKQL